MYGFLPLRLDIRFPSQIEIGHKNQVPMLLAPPPKSRSFFNFLAQVTIMTIMTIVMTMITIKMQSLTSSFQIGGRQEDGYD